jgi:hypothetical protein
LASHGLAACEFALVHVVKMITKLRPKPTKGSQKEDEIEGVSELFFSDVGVLVHQEWIGDGSIAQQAEAIHRVGKVVDGWERFVRAPLRGRDGAALQAVERSPSLQLS